MQRSAVLSGYPFEEAYGYARAVRVGPHVFVSGTTARGADLASDAGTQFAAAVAVIEAALRQAGAELRQVVRTVIYAIDFADTAAIAQAHKEAFGTATPASTLVQVAALTPVGARVEIEVTAIVYD